MLPVSSTMATSTSSPRPLLHVPFVYVTLITATVPTASLLTIFALGVYLHLDVTTATHCKVHNVIPSISAVVGGVTPERYIWRLGMAFFIIPRLFDSFLYYNFLGQSLNEFGGIFRWGNRLLFFLHWVQYLSLAGLSYVSSKENYFIHRNSFIGFIASSVLHMILFLFLFKVSRQPPTYRDKVSYRLRVVFVAAHILIFLISLYFYWRHNKYCEPYMYSWYSLCEYLVVLTNIAFHMVEFVDFQNDYYISVAPPSRLKHY